jgi:hypothetical protein
MIGHGATDALKDLSLVQIFKEQCHSDFLPKSPARFTAFAGRGSLIASTLPNHGESQKTLVLIVRDRERTGRVNSKPPMVGQPSGFCLGCRHERLSGPLIVERQGRHRHYRLVLPPLGMVARIPRELRLG